MRRGNDNGFLYTEDGKTLIGVNLGADYVSEHEWGIKGLHSTFAIPFADETKLGLEKRTITAVPSAPDFTFQRTKKNAILYYRRTLAYADVTAEADQERSIEHAKKGELALWRGSLATAWDERSFGVLTADAKQMNELAELYEAFLRKDIAIWLGGGGVFENAGLVLGIVSRVPADKAKHMRDVDEDRIKLAARAAGTKIEEELDRAGKKWFALHPSWTNKSKHKTKYDVVFFLNPREQHIYNSGWFTVEQLREWIQDKGPVMGGRRAR